jgi:hypothetical protein
VRLIGVHAVEELLVDDLVALNDHQGVGVGPFHEGRHIGHRTGVRIFDLDLVDALVDRLVDADRLVGGRDRSGGINHPHVQVGPPVERRGQQGIGPRDSFIGRR